MAKNLSIAGGGRQRFFQMADLNKVGFEQVYETDKDYQILPGTQPVRDVGTLETAIGAGPAAELLQKMGSKITEKDIMAGSLNTTQEQRLKSLYGDFSYPATPPDTFSAITSANIAPAADLSKQITYPATTPIPSVNYDAYTLTEPTKLSSEQQGVQDLIKRIQQQNLDIAGKAAYEQQQIQTQDIAGKETIVRDLTSQLLGIKNEATAIPLSLEQQAAGRGITTTILGRQQQELLRQNAIKALTVSAQLEAAKGNLQTALDMVERAVAARYNPIEEGIRVNQANLDLIIRSPLYDAEEKQRAEIQKELQNEKLTEVKLDRNNYEDNLKLANDLIKNGFTDTTIVRAVQNAKDENGRPSIAKAQEIIARSGFYKKESISTPIPTPTPTVLLDEKGIELEYGTPEYVVERLKATSGSKTKPVASEREQLGKFANVVALTDNLMKSLDVTANGPVIGYLKSLNPYSFDARAVNAQVTALVPSVARALYGEVGVLTDTDIERYLTTLPNIKSTTDQNKFIAAMTLSNAKRAYEQTLLNLANSNVNVSGFADSYKNLTGKLDKIEKDLGVQTGKEVVGVDSNRVDIFDEVISKPQGYWSNLWNAITGK